ncbi:hypothetical protein B9Z55_019146 [Caenorhabditis nigoni]|uniref:Uncharacterized protein n=1 Tax=Caenorhabditis nigoni TaxID=1611254 RepID=A0A2G5THU9_9PELO|nr:hypothetical protein B9Z55_019146 [Caenorhabditis nigoni]
MERKDGEGSFNGFLKGKSSLPPDKLRSGVSKARKDFQLSTARTSIPRIRWTWMSRRNQQLLRSFQDEKNLKILLF